MADFPALPLLTDAYIADTQHLTNEEHGVYLRLLMFAWRTRDCSLPDDDKRLALMVGATAKKWARLKPVVMAFWSLHEGAWKQKKLTSQRDFVERQREQKSAAGKASSDARALKTQELEPTAVATAKPTADPTARQQSISISNKEKKEEEEPIGSSKKNPRRSMSLPPGWVPSERNIERFLTPADKRQIEEWLAELSVICAKRRDGEFDEALRLEAYTSRLAQYPADVARHAVLDHSWRFWPAWEELERVCDALAGPRRHMLHALKAPPPPPEPERRPPTAEERERIAVLIAELSPEVSQACRDEAVSQALAGDCMRAAE
jgi:uncharacterized protein YdaU (DUF1376 family)